MKFPFFKKRNRKKLTIQLAGATDVGLKRVQNEDSFVPNTWPQKCDGIDALLIVADGMGGLKAGDVASEIAVSFIIERLNEQLLKQTLRGDNIGPNLSSIVREANLEIYSQGSTGPDGRREAMGTTCTVGLVFKNKLYISHAGDSRAYLFRNNQLSQLTKDDSWVMDQVSAGNLTQAQARQHRNRNIVTQALGINEDIDVEDVAVELRSGDRIMLCSDGLHGLVEDDEIRSILMYPNQESAIDTLVDRAKSHGGDDNITVVIGDISV